MVPEDADLLDLHNKVCAVVGFISQGHAHALKLKYSGIEVSAENSITSIIGRNRSSLHYVNRTRKENVDTMNIISVDVETNDKLKKAKLENGFYNIIDGQRVSARKTLSIVNPATGKQLAIVPDVDRALLDEAVSASQKAFPGWRE